MPEVSRFYGIVIQIYYDDHPPPHFHAIYGKETAKFDIDTLKVVVGELPNRARKLVKDGQRFIKRSCEKHFNARPTFSDQERLPRCLNANKKAPGKLGRNLASTSEIRIWRIASRQFAGCRNWFWRHAPSQSRDMPRYPASSILKNSQIAP